MKASKYECWFLLSKISFSLDLFLWWNYLFSGFIFRFISFFLTFSNMPSHSFIVIRVFLRLSIHVWRLNTHRKLSSLIWCWLLGLCIAVPHVLCTGFSAAKKIGNENWQFIEKDFSFFSRNKWSESKTKALDLQIATDLTERH